MTYNYALSTEGAGFTKQLRLTNCHGVLQIEECQMGWLVILTAGSAKKEMPRMAQKAAISLPGHVIGTASPYPTVHSVICKTTRQHDILLLKSNNLCITT